MAKRDWSGGRSPEQNRRLARAPERKEEPIGNKTGNRAKGGIINAPTETPANYSKGRWRLI